MIDLNFAYRDMLDQMNLKIVPRFIFLRADGWAVAHTVSPILVVSCILMLILDG